MQLKAPLFILFLIPFYLFSQTKPQDDDMDSLFDDLDDITIKENKEVIATFKSTRLMLGQSTERVKANQLHFRISHVFGKIKGIDNFFGLDNINNMNISFEYGLSDFIQLGLARSNKPDKTYSSSVKLSLLRQIYGENAFPFSLSYYGGLDIKSRTYFPEARNKNFNGRLDYVNQILISRKISEKLSVQLSPTWIHRNLTETVNDPNSIVSIGIGGRYLISGSTSINIEYFDTLDTFDAYELNKNTLSVGFDIETGGHVFQLYFTNAFALHPGKFAINQSGDFFNREINFGFSLLREFSISKKNKH
ncbi:hypothetical protein FPF71_07340 [Algibacter amylolyticus]|uniref:DUF5777 domain-containing protein n=1 Tax=Algibacter amylolyticus TaxID=1608400 RepID=A0A5M7B841_9FLAO|nr:DUF5777 family beta-barrel protein [Algibacter amylolyticus]KAA5825716.1 hypothetical protein F2B50_07340 [Algibacter amylolyticus]MBB5268050.1 hypothetical protein [Algibacter amylolyticus]TSJ80014.1 hypothetical protein FPF71_07340 [Algibacter amylolyticus]